MARLSIDMDTQPSRITVDPTGESAVAVVGVIDSHTAEDLLDRLRSLGTDHDVEVDLSGVEFIDSSGLRTIVTVHQDLEAAGQSLILVGISSAVERLFEITGLHDHLHIR